MKKKSIARAITTAGLALAFTVAVPLAASAHVPVTPNTAAAGTYATLTFKVPTESATATTVKVEIDLPTDTPFGSVTYQPVTGWTANVVTSTLATPVTTDDGTITEAPSQITFTADANSAIQDGQFQQFVIAVGPVPDTGSVLFPVHQTYSDGSVVNWIDPTPASGVEPANPAPTLYIDDAPPAGAAAGGASGAGGATVAATAGAAAGAGSDSGSAASGSAASNSTSAEDALAIGIGIAGLALGAVALIVAVLAITRARARVAAGAVAAGAVAAGAAAVDAREEPKGE